jgi:hypothetical protein
VKLTNSGTTGGIKEESMRYLKILGLAILAATALMAFVGSASATMIYSTGPTTLGAGTVIVRSLEGSSILKSGTTTLNTCTGGKFSSEIKNAGSATAPVSEANTTFDSESCVSTVHTEKLGTLQIEHIAGTTNGTLKMSGFVTGTTIFGTNCLYESGTAKHVGTLVGSLLGDATIGINTTVNEAEPKKAICPDTATWQANYKVTSPTPLWVEAS